MPSAAIKYCPVYLSKRIRWEQGGSPEQDCTVFLNIPVSILFTSRSLA